MKALCLLATAAVLILLLCGCGCGCGGDGRAASSRLQRGRNVFAATCTGCQTLTGRDSRAPGGDLAIANLSARDIASFVRVMPVHLSSDQVNAVAAYVHAAAARSR